MNIYVVHAEHYVSWYLYEAGARNCFNRHIEVFPAKDAYLCSFCLDSKEHSSFNIDWEVEVAMHDGYILEPIAAYRPVWRRNLPYIALLAGILLAMFATYNHLRG